MAATILNSDRAIAMSTYVVRAFVGMRREMTTNTALEARLAKIEQELLAQDEAIRTLFVQIKSLLLAPSPPPAREMGFHTGMRKKPADSDSSSSPSRLAGRRSRAALALEHRV